MGKMMRFSWFRIFLYFFSGSFFFQRTPNSYWDIYTCNEKHCSLRGLVEWWEGGQPSAFREAVLFLVFCSPLPWLVVVMAAL